MTKQYDDILFNLKMRLLQKHKEYENSYLDSSYEYLAHRFMSKKEDTASSFYDADKDGIIRNCIDLAAYALLIADKAMRDESI